MNKNLYSFTKKLIGSLLIAVMVFIGISFSFFSDIGKVEVAEASGAITKQISISQDKQHIVKIETDGKLHYASLANLDESNPDFNSLAWQPIAEGNCKNFYKALINSNDPDSTSSTIEKSIWALCRDNNTSTTGFDVYRYKLGTTSIQTNDITAWEKVSTEVCEQVCTGPLLARECTLTCNDQTGKLVDIASATYYHNSYAVVVGANAEGNVYKIVDKDKDQTWQKLDNPASGAKVKLVAANKAGRFFVMDEKGNVFFNSFLNNIDGTNDPWVRKHQGTTNDKKMKQLFSGTIGVYGIDQGNGLLKLTNSSVSNNVPDNSEWKETEFKNISSFDFYSEIKFDLYNDIKFVTVDMEGKIQAQNLFTIAQSQDNLIATISDILSGGLKVIYNWFVSNQSILELNMPFDTDADCGSENDKVCDYSNNRRHGVFDNNANKKPIYKLTDGYDNNGYYEFDGNDYIVTDQTPFKLGSNGKSFTVSFWVRTSEKWDSWKVLLETGAWEQGAFTFASKSQDWFKMDFYDTNSAPLLCNDPTWSDGNWHHIVGVFDNDRNRSKVYLDGNICDEEIERFEPNNIDLPLYIGSRNGSYGFDGGIDEVQIYSRALSTAQIKLLYNKNTNIIAEEEINDGEEWQACAITADGGNVCTEEIKTNKAQKNYWDQIYISQDQQHAVAINTKGKLHYAKVTSNTNFSTLDWKQPINDAQCESFSAASINEKSIFALCDKTYQLGSNDYNTYKYNLSTKIWTKVEGRAKQIWTIHNDTEDKEYVWGISETERIWYNVYDSSGNTINDGWKQTTNTNARLELLTSTNSGHIYGINKYNNVYESLTYDGESWPKLFDGNIPMQQIVSNSDGSKVYALGSDGKLRKQKNSNSWEDTVHTGIRSFALFDDNDIVYIDNKGKIRVLFTGSANPDNISPISGLACTNWNRRPISVMQPADVYARPAAGFSKADLVFELPAHTASITRLLGVYLCDIPDEIGAIRSARHDHIALAKGVDAIFVHWGGSRFAYDLLKENVIDNIDCMSSSACERWSISGIMRKEDTGHIKKDNLFSTIKSSSFRETTNFVGYPHKEDALLGERPNGGHLRVAFAKPYDVEYDYDKGTNSWPRTWSGVPDIDKNNDQRVAPKNIVVMMAESEQIFDETDYVGKGLRDPWAGVTDDISGYYNNVQIGDPWYDLTDTGEAFYYMDGKETKGTWKKDKGSLDSKLFFYDGNGQEVEFVPGQIWVEILEPGQVLKWVPTT